MQKKTLSFSLCILLVIAILGCGAPSGGSQSTNSNDKATITVAARSGSHFDVINTVKAKFENEYNCSVKLISLSADAIHSSVINDAPNTVGIYDVIMIDDPLMPEYVEKNVLTNLTQLGYIDDEDFVEKSRLLGKDPYPLGATYALPFSGNVQLIFYNPKVLGSSPDLSSWDTILGQCQNLSQSGQKGYIIRGQTGNPIVSDFLPIMWAFGGDIFDSNNSVIVDSPENRDALNFYLELLKTGDNCNKDELINEISSGEAAIGLGWPSWFITENGNSAEIAQIPGKRDTKSPSLATGEIGNWLIGITNNSANKELALELIKYLTSTEVQEEALHYGGIPTRKSIFKNSEILSEYPYFDTIYTGTNNSRVRPRTAKWSQIEDVFGEKLVKCIDGKVTADECLTESQAAIEALISK